MTARLTVREIQRAGKNAHDRYRERHYTADTRAVLGSRVEDSRIVVPENVMRLDTHVPCGFCGVRGRCKHRPWVNHA